MNIKTISDRVLFALSVPKCVGCLEPLEYGEKAFCPKCSLEFEEIKNRNCSRCAKKLNYCGCSNEYLESHFVRRVSKSFRYMIRGDNLNVANSLIFSLKRQNREDVLEFAAREMSANIRNIVDTPEMYIITNVPRRRKAIIEFGIDHSSLLAERVAELLGAEYISILKSNSRKPQKSLERADRLKNVEFEIVNDIDISGRSVIIVDDVITTGASVGAAAMLLKSLGAKNIVAASLGIAYKDKYDGAGYEKIR